MERMYACFNFYFKKLILNICRPKLGLFQNVDIDDETFYINGIRGAKQFLLHEPLEATRGTRIRLQFLFFLNYFVQIAAFLLIGRVLLQYLYGKLSNA